MKKNYVYIFLILVVVSCSQNAVRKEVKESFEQIINSLKIENSQKIDMLIPLLENKKEEEKSLFLIPFRKLIDTDYKLNITKKSDKLYYIKVDTNNTDSLWSGIILPFELNQDGNWVMAPIINMIQTFEIVPAKKLE